MSETQPTRIDVEELGDQMKFFEKQTEIKMMPMLPTLARIDGRAFHSFTRGLKRPYDEKFSMCMMLTARQLAEETNARLTYTQSDEITLCWLADSFKSQIWFNNKHSKMVSNLASLATLYFYKNAENILPAYINRNPTFDARVWQVPNKEEACRVFGWREIDATKNSVAAAASAILGHRKIQGKNSSQMQEMMYQDAKVNWNDYPVPFKRGIYIQRQKTSRPFTAEEIDKLPEKHQARLNPDLVVERSSFRFISVPPFRRIINREEFVFDGARPITSKDERTSHNRPIPGPSSEGDVVGPQKEEGETSAVPAGV